MFLTQSMSPPSPLQHSSTAEVMRSQADGICFVSLTGDHGKKKIKKLPQLGPRLAKLLPKITWDP